MKQHEIQQRLNLLFGTEEKEKEAEKGEEDEKDTTLGKEDKAAAETGYKTVKEDATSDT